MKALEIIARDQVTILEGVPTMYHAMLNVHDPADTSSLRVCVSGGSAMPVEVMKTFEKAFDCIILEGYGLSETSPVASFNHPDRERKAGSIGTPIEGVEMKLVDEDDKDVAQGDVGEIVIRGHNVMKGYWQREDATEEVMRGGWFHSGDMATQDEDGYFFIVDRKKDMIIRGGYNVYPREIEEVLYEHPAVSEAAVIGVPDDSLGEEVAAMVVLKGEASEDELRAFVKERVAAYKYPRKIWFSEELPKGPTGKILKREIKAPQRAMLRRPLAAQRASVDPVGEAQEHGLHPVVGGDPLVERRHRLRALVLRGEHAVAEQRVVEHEHAARSQARDERVVVGGIAGLVGVDVREVDMRFLGQVRQVLRRRAECDRDAVGHARRLDVALRDRGELLADLEARQPAAFGQAAGDADRAVPGERADLDGGLGVEHAREDRQQRRLVGAREHPGVGEQPGLGLHAGEHLVLPGEAGQVGGQFRIPGHPAMIARRKRRSLRTF